MNKRDRLLTTAEVAAACGGVTSTVVCQWIRAGHLRAEPFGGRGANGPRLYLVRSSDVRAFRERYPRGLPRGRPVKAET